jgi:phage terminase small subunit
VSTPSGVKKSPTVSALESLRRDILNLEDALGLTPRGLLKLNEKAFEKTKKPKVDGLI